jgi:microcystin degradation protein MlrC
VRLRIFAAGLETETNTFAPVPTALEDFHVQRGRDSLEGRLAYSSVNLDMLWGTRARARGDEFVFSLMASAEPSGITLKSAYETLRDELLADLRAAMPVDVVLLMLHGAMIAHAYEDCEEDILCKVREIAGNRAVIGVELDLHCHLTHAKIAPADIVITYKEYPHVDVNARAAELFDLAVRAREGKIRPTAALFDCRMIGLYPTTREPMRQFVDDMMQAEKRPGLLSVSFGHGFQFADVSNVGSKVLVWTDGNPTLAHSVAREFGLRVYGMRERIGCDRFALPLPRALSRARASDRTPVVVADQSDNAGGGAPADSTYALRWLLEHRVNNAGMAIFYDPEVVKIARKAGMGSRLSVRLGGKMGPFSGDPVDLEVVVGQMREHYLHAFPQQSGDPWMFHAGDVVALRHGSLDLVVSSARCQCVAPSIFTDLDIDITSKQLFVVKSVQHFYGAFAPIAGDVIYMAGPGSNPPDPRLMSYRRLDIRRLYPWAEDPLQAKAEVRGR